MRWGAGAPALLLLASCIRRPVESPAAAETWPNPPRTAPAPTSEAPALPKSAPPPLLVEVGSTQVLIAGEPVREDELELRGALARGLVEPSRAVIVSLSPGASVATLVRLVRGARGTSLTSLAFEADGARIDVALQPPAATDQKWLQLDLQAALPVLSPWPGGDESSTPPEQWVPGDSASEARASSFFRRECAGACEVRVVLSDTAKLGQLDAVLGWIARERTEAKGMFLHFTEPGLPVKSVSGRLPPEVIQSIVRQQFGEFRKCYETGLGRDPSLTGKVVARFVIDREGKVSEVRDGGSDLPDPSVRECVLKAFRQLSFPKPEGGTVAVVYPIMLAPG